MGKGAARPAAPGAGTSPLEWTVAGLGAALLIAAAGYLAWHGWTGEAGPPDLVIESDREPGGAATGWRSGSRTSGAAPRPRWRFRAS